METPFPFTTLTLVSGQSSDFISESLPSSAASAVHSLDELFLLTFPKTAENRLRLVKIDDTLANPDHI